VSKLASAYLYVFYKYYRLRRFWLMPAAEYGALASLLMVEGLNICTLVCVADLFVGRGLLPLFSSTQSVWLLATLAIPQYFVLVYRSRYKRIAQRFVHESTRHSLLGGIAVGIYTLGSFLVFFWLTSLPPQKA
jgi:hypothetical protein